MNRFLLPIVLILLTSAIATGQNNNVQWSRYLNDTTKMHFAHEGIVQALCSDSLNNIYVCMSVNVSDSTIATIKKLSPAGDILWERSVLPYFDSLNYYTYHTTSALSCKNGKLTLVATAMSLTPSQTNNFILVKQWNLNGQIINQKSKVIDHSSYSLDLGEVITDSSGNTFISFTNTDVQNSLEGIWAVDNNLDSIFYYGDTVDAASYTYPSVALMDTTIAILSNHSRVIGAGVVTYIKNISLSNANVVWSDSIIAPTDGNLKIFIRYWNNSLYCVGGGISKYALNGTLLWEKPSQPIWSMLPQQDGTFYTTGVNSYAVNQYDADGELLNSIAPNIAFSTENKGYKLIEKDSMLYLYGYRQPDPNYGEASHLLLTRINKTGAIVDTNSYSLTEEGKFWLLGDLTTDHDDNVIVAATSFFNGPIDSTGVSGTSAMPLVLYKICYNNCTDSVTIPPPVVTQLKAYPNPNSGNVLHIEIALAKSQKIKIEIRNSIGKSFPITEDYYFEKGTHTFQTDIGSLSPGIYLLELLTDEGPITAKIQINSR